MKLTSNAAVTSPCGEAQQQNLSGDRNTTRYTAAFSSKLQGQHPVELKERMGCD